MYGSQRNSSNPFPALNKEAFIERYNSRPKNRRYGETPNKYEYEQHFNNALTLYFFGNDDPRCPYTLAMIDVDVQKKLKLGTPEGARAFAEHLKTIFPDAYFEPSTNGLGMHGYVLIFKPDQVASEIKRGMSNLQAYLTKEAEGYDIEMVEVKGQPCVAAWAGRDIEAITYGQFAKLPRKATLEEMQNLEVVPLWDLLNSLMFNIGDTPKNDVTKIGSCSFEIADADKIERLEKFAFSYVSNCDLKAGRGKVTAHDFAGALAILQWTYLHPNKDKQTPTAWIRFHWTELFNKGILKRAFDPQKWKIIRDHLSDRGLLNVIDSRYWFDNDKSKGKAMQWQITDSFAELLEKVVGPAPLLKTGGDLYTDKIATAWRECLGEGENLIPQLVFKTIKPRWWWDGYILDRLAA